MPKRKTALEKLHNGKQPHIVSPIPEGSPGWKENHSMVVSTPLEVDGVIREIPEGRLVTLDELRQHLARRHAADIACPLSTAIFVNIAAAAAEERRAEGHDDITPYWRVLKTGGLLNDKFPGGTEAQRALLEAEGFSVAQRGKKVYVEDYEAALAEL